MTVGSADGGRTRGNCCSCCSTDDHHWMATPLNGAAPIEFYLIHRTRFGSKLMASKSTCLLWRHHCHLIWLKTSYMYVIFKLDSTTNVSFEQNAYLASSILCSVPGDIGRARIFSCLAFISCCNQMVKRHITWSLLRMHESKRDGRVSKWLL